MSFDLTKDERKRKAELVGALEEKRAAVEVALEVYNREASEVFGKLQAAVIAFNEAVEQAKAFAEDIASEKQAEFDDRSERWQQESERGQAVQEFISHWEQLELDALEVEEPDEITLDMPQPELLSDAQEEVES